jgi:arylamine N-acetyltransferase
MLAALAREAAVQDTEYVANYVTEALAARELLYAGLEKLGIEQAPSSANFILGYFGDRAIEVRDALREKAFWCATAATKFPAACASPSARASRSRASSTNWSESGEGPDRIRHGRRAGGRDRVLSRRHSGDGRAFHRREPTRDEIQDWKNRGGWNDDWQLSHRMIQERGGKRRPMRPWSIISREFSTATERTA